MYELILQKSTSDLRLSSLLAEAAEYAEVYALSKKRQKGCDGMGEASTLKEEYSTALEDLMNYCMESGYITDRVKADADMLVREFMRDQL